MPTATSALPPDQAITSAGIASIREVGLEIGNTIGRSTAALIVSMTSRVNAPCTVEVPSKMVGAACLTVSRQGDRPATGRPARDLARVARIRPLEVAQVRHVRR